MNSAWSARWSREEADEFLFLVGDLWLIVDREELLGDNAQQNKVTTIKGVNDISWNTIFLADLNLSYKDLH